MTDGPSPFDGVDGLDMPDSGDEEDTERDGFLSYAGEWHAMALGFGVGLTGTKALIGLFIAFVFGIGTEKLRMSPHLKDAAEESAYSVGGVGIGLAVNVLLFGGSIIPEVVLLLR